jgi:histidinol-phosphate/aromatic aminotransferase/cobyric acid decarboxylase-like protein/GNAT superfamily N-acetyltransferase
MFIDFIDDKTTYLTQIRSKILVKELQQYTHETHEISNVLIGLYTDERSVVGYIAINRPEDGHKTIHVYNEWKDAYEVRGLMILPKFRGNGYAKLLLWAAARFIQASQGKVLIGSARKEILPLYMSFGFKPIYEAASTIGKVEYIPGSMTVDNIQPIFGHLNDDIEWRLPFPILRPTLCKHGNGSIETNKTIIRADVLDAWYDPSPQVMQALDNIKGKVLRRTPGEPDALRDIISKTRNISKSSIIIGPGSSAFMYTVFPLWFKKGDRVLIVTPTYAEYSHLLTRLGCYIDEVHEERDIHHYILNKVYHGIIIVNPNSPSGHYIPNLSHTLKDVPLRTKVWIDETYIDYVGNSLEKFASQSPNVVICKSMSKIYALSGLRLGYIVGSGVQLENIQQRIPPWWCSTISIQCGILALQSQLYYTQKMKETRMSLDYLIEELQKIDGIELIGNPVANFASFILPCDIHTFMNTMKTKYGIYVKEAHGYPNAVRIASQSIEVCVYMVRAIKTFLHLSV